MEQEPISEEKKIVLEQVPENVTDMELLFFYMKHIENPCNLELNIGGQKVIVDIRYFYINGAKELLPRLRNSFAKKEFQILLNKYPEDFIKSKIQEAEKLYKESKNIL